MKSTKQAQRATKENLESWTPAQRKGAWDKTTAFEEIQEVENENRKTARTRPGWVKLPDIREDEREVIGTLNLNFAEDEEEESENLSTPSSIGSGYLEYSPRQQSKMHQNNLEELRLPLMEGEGLDPTASEMTSRTRKKLAEGRGITRKEGKYEDRTLREAIQITRQQKQGAFTAAKGTSGTNRTNEIIAEAREKLERSLDRIRKAREESERKLQEAKEMAKQAKNLSKEIQAGRAALQQAGRGVARPTYPEYKERQNIKEGVENIRQKAIRRMAEIASVEAKSRDGIYNNQFPIKPQSAVEFAKQTRNMRLNSLKYLGQQEHKTGDFRNPYQEEIAAGERVRSLKAGEMITRRNNNLLPTPQPIIKAPQKGIKRGAEGVKLPPIAQQSTGITALGVARQKPVWRKQWVNMSRKNANGERGLL